MTPRSGVRRTLLGTGWDSRAVLVDATWVERTARGRDAEPWLRTETHLLPWLAPQLPLDVPQPVPTGENPLVVRHRLIPGRPCVEPDATQARAVALFLRALHDTPLDGAVTRGVPDAATTRRWRDSALARFDAEVLPLLPAASGSAIARALDRLRDAPAGVLVHGDLRDEHVLVDDRGVVTGVIDWSDARIGDPSKDLAWLLRHRRVAAAVVEAYGGDLTARARDWDLIGPCYAVVHGVDTRDEDLVRRSVALLAAAGTRSP